VSTDNTDTGQATEIVSFGCRLNAFEAEVMRGHAKCAGLENAVIINTCAVTTESERQSRQAIRKARRDHPGATVIVTGCAAQINPDGYSSMEEVDHVIGNSEKLAPESFARIKTKTDTPRVLVADIMTVRETAGHLVEGFEGKARAFVEVQQGCDHRCTFCIIPFGRGNSRSVPIKGVLQQTRALVDKGFQEIVLTGVDLTAYGEDLPETPSLGTLTRALLDQVPELPRLRLSSIDVAEVDDALFDVITTEPRVMAQLHLSLQAGDDMILKRMKRRHTRDQAIEFCNAVRAIRPETVFGADLIAGFPTETDAMFENSLHLIEDAGLTWLHVFPFSARPDTPAAQMPAINGTIIKARAKALREAGEKARDSFLKSCIGTQESVLIEQPGIGRTERFARVALTGTAPVGTIAPAEITGQKDGQLSGRLLS
jgi:threonylcarbamoyladenosine tRNA methylthiotransferase MtaB